MLNPAPHNHTFHTGNRAGIRVTGLVAKITAATMVVEIALGWWFNSMALLADGWHMSTHAFAIGLAAFAYRAAQRYADDPRFAFGTWKIEVLASYTSALFLLGVAALMVVTSLERLASPQPIHYAEAMAVAFLGLIVNIVCAVVLGDAAEGHDHPHEHHHRDLNLRAAYLHVMADAATSVLAILALLGGMYLGWSWLDPVMGVVGAALVASWARGLLRETGGILLDAEMDQPLTGKIRQAIAAMDGSPRLIDLHLWRVGREKFACILSLESSAEAVTQSRVKSHLAQFSELAHVTVELVYSPPGSHSASSSL
ncbi:MAG: cobalt transporter [Alphaproteobacteria bacterium RIFOXYD12_FULL_60_8]|nr:MAG: cobalt transporter [Alphaproteobacteria bacterium RIFOXYD12_FULL_60_8]